LGTCVGLFRFLSWRVFDRLLRSCNNHDAKKADRCGAKADPPELGGNPLHLSVHESP
jgi:hypothetical protein